METNKLILNDIADGFSIIGKATGKQKERAIERVANEHSFAWQALTYLLDPFKTYGVGPSAKNKKVDLPPNRVYLDIFELLNDLNIRSGITNQDIANIQNFCNSCGDLDWVAWGLLFKNIRLGVTGKTVNKVIPGRIHSFSCMLANKYFDHPTAMHGRSFSITEKFDGIRCITVVTGEGVKMYSRQGQEIEGLLEIQYELMKVYQSPGEGFETGFVLDGELLITDRDKFPSKEQYKQTTNIVRRDGVKTGITYHVFDYLTLDEFREQIGYYPYVYRRQTLESLLKDTGPAVELVPVLYSGDDESQIMRQLNMQIAAEHEGIMLNRNDAVYQFKRTNDLLKVKVMQDCDLRIIDIQEGSGKFAGMTGSVIVDYKGNQLGVGSGLSDEQRQDFWTNRSKYIGRIIAVQYFEETNDADGKLSLRFPVFLDLREEGKEVSYT